MLVSLVDILSPAKKEKYAVGSFNVINLDYAIGIVEAAEEERSPVIIQISPTIMHLYKDEPIVMACNKLATLSSVPVCLHLDHGKDLETVLQSVSFGFSSVMFDGSLLPFQENVRITSGIVRIAHQKGISVEAEIGIVGKDENNLHNQLYPNSKFTDVKEAVAFCDQTDIDALAVSVGNVHGVTSPEIELNDALLHELHLAIDKPLVLHGSSGVLDASILLAIKNGVCKINVATRVINQVGQCIIEHYRENMDFLQHNQLTKKIIQSVKEEVKNRIQLFGSTNRI